ncbi:MAG: hypothetical protein ACREUT_12995 [Steroidobacteraceae bacterium]
MSDRGMSDKEILRARAREALRTGRIPDRPPDRIWGGPGMGARCAVCDEPIGQNESELELQFADDCEGDPAPCSGKRMGGKSAGTNCHVHVACLAAWELERQNGNELPVSSEKGIINIDEREIAEGARAQ